LAQVRTPLQPAFGLFDQTRTPRWRVRRCQKSEAAMQAARDQESGATKAAEDPKLEERARKLCIAAAFMMTAVTMVVPTRAPMVLQIKKGDAALTARAMGLMSTFAAIIELVVNPILGKLSDEHGRKFFLMMAPAVNAFLHSLVVLKPMSLPMQFIDRMISGSMIFGFAAPAQAALADLFSHDPQKLGVWTAGYGMYFGLGATIGPLIGSKLGGARSFFFSSLTFLAAMLYVQTSFEETLSESSKKKFKFSDINPVAFLKLFKEKTLTMLSCATALQSFGDYVNIYDINNLFMMKVLNYGPSQIGNFAMTVGLTQTAGGFVSKEVIKKVGLKQFTLFANLMWAIGMSTMGTARTTAHAFFALFLWTFGHQRNSGVSTYMQKYGQKQDMGKAEIIAANGNLLAYIKVLIPLFYSNLFAWATSNGRNMPGLPYFVISTLTMLSQIAFFAAAPQD